MTSRTWKRLLAGSLTLLMIFLATACGVGLQQPPAVTPTVQTPPEPVTLVWATPGNPQEVAVYRKVADDFMKKHPHITIRVDEDADDYNKVTTLIAGGQPPDILYFTLNDWPSMAGKNILLPLDDLIKQSKYDIDDFFEQIIKPYRFDGKRYGQGALYGIPKEISVRPMYYNKDMFKAAGVTPPPIDSPWTFEQYLEAMKKLTIVEGGRTVQYGLVPEVWWGSWMIFAWANGGDAVDDPYAPTKSTLDDPRVVEALEFFARMHTELKVAPSAQVTQELGRSQMFASGRAATYYNGRWMVPLFRQSKFEWDVMPFPTGKGGRGQNLTGSMFGISTKTKNPQAAWLFLSYIVGVEAQTEMTKLGLLFPSRKSVAQSDIFLKSAPPEHSRVFLDEVPYARLLPLHPKYPQMRKVIDDEVALVLAGSKSAADAVKVMHQKVNELLK